MGRGNLTGNHLALRVHGTLTLALTPIPEHDRNGLHKNLYKVAQQLYCKTDEITNLFKQGPR